MSKAMELKILKAGKSIDAPINYHHRTGDSEGEGGNMLDIYAQAESVEDVLIGDEEERAKALFFKGVKAYLKNVFIKPERDFLRAVMDGKKKLHEIGKEMGVDWLTYLSFIREKAYKNIEPLQTLALKVGWSGAEAYVNALLKRLETLGKEDPKQVTKEERAKIRNELNAVRAENAEEKRAGKSAENAFYNRGQKPAKEKRVQYLGTIRKWRENNPEKIKAYQEKQKAKREELKQQRKAGALTLEEEYAQVVELLKAARAATPVDFYYVEQLRQREYYLRTRAKRLEYRKKYNDEHKEQRAAYKKAYRERLKAAAQQ